MEASGRHLILEMWDCDREILNDVKVIREIVQGAVTEARATVIKIMAHEFTPPGVTCMAILAESHLSVHTWPEEGYVAADIFTCGRSADPRLAAEYLLRAFKPKDSKTVELKRGVPSLRKAVQSALGGTT